MFSETHSHITYVIWSVQLFPLIDKSHSGAKLLESLWGKGMMERPSTFWWRKSRCSGAAQHFLFGDRVKRWRVGGCFKRKPAKKQHSKQLNKYSWKGNQQEQRHRLHGFGWARCLAEGEMPCGALRVWGELAFSTSLLLCCFQGADDAQDDDDEDEISWFAEGCSCFCNANVLLKAWIASWNLQRQ